MNVFTLLGVLFVGLKLADVIFWSWWLVLAPFYVGFIFTLFCIVVIALSKD